MPPTSRGCVVGLTTSWSSAWASGALFRRHMLAVRVVRMLAAHTDMADLEWVDKLSNGRVDVTFGSALDIFGGQGVQLADLIAWNRHAQAIHAI